MTLPVSTNFVKIKDKTWSFIEVLDTFETIEKELQLDESLIAGVPWWDALRYPLFNKILQELKLHEKAKIKRQKPSLLKRLNKGLKLSFTALKVFFPGSPLLVSRNSVVIWGHPRRKYENGLYVDIYSDPLVKLFPDDLQVAILERLEGQDHLKPVPTQNLFYVESLFAIARILSTLLKRLHRTAVSEDVFRLEDMLFQRFNVNLDLNELVLQVILNWHGLYSVMYLFFLYKKPSHFFLVVSAGHEAVIAAAKAAMIPVIELQHGSPARGKLNYDYSSGINKRSFPDYFLSFGEYWVKNLRFPLPKDKIIAFGFPYLANKLSAYSAVKKEDTLLVISQQVHSKSLADFAIQAARLNAQIDIVFKPHPSEYCLEEPNYFRTLRESGISIAERDSDIYYLFARARWQVGVYSTALYEGLCFGVALFLLPLAGYECMNPLISSGLAKLIEDSHGFDANWTLRPDDMRGIFADPSTCKLDKVLSITRS